MMGTFRCFERITTAEINPSRLPCILALFLFARRFRGLSSDSDAFAIYRFSQARNGWTLEVRMSNLK